MRATARFEKALPWLFFAAGIAVAYRYADQNAAPGESGQAALALLQTGTIGDPYAVPTGATGHVSPCLVWLLAAIYWLFGGNSTAARFAMGAVTALLYALSVTATLRLCAAGTERRAATWIAGGLLVLTPMFLFQSVAYARQWDQPFAAYALVLGWLVFERSRTATRPYWSELQMAALAGVGGLCSPSVLPTLVAALAAMIWMRRSVADIRLAALLSAAVIAACLLPWGLRNELVLGDFILTRSNFGLELDVGNAPGALGYSGSGTEAALHPHDSVVEAMQVRKLGEIAYMQQKTRRAEAWITENPAQFLWLTVQRVRLTFFPVPAMVGGVSGLGATLRWVALLGFGALKASALLIAIAARRKPLLALTFSVLPLASYFITHVNMRYELVPYFTSIAVIALTGDWLLQVLNIRRHQPAATSRPVQSPR